MSAPLQTLVGIVDDDASVRKGLARLVTTAGYRVEVFASAREFLERPRLGDLCCLVLDVRMPGLTGLELQEALAAAAAHHGVKSSFEVVRGSPAGGLLGTSEGDLIVACSLTRPVDGHFRVECRWWSSVGAAPGSFLLARRPWDIAGAVLALLRDREPTSVRVLEAAALLAERAISAERRTFTSRSPRLQAGRRVGGGVTGTSSPRTGTSDGSTKGSRLLPARMASYQRRW